MAKVATSGSLSSKPLPNGGGTMKFGAGTKRKTPSELRGEQLKQTNVIDIIDDSPAPLVEPMKSCSKSALRLKKSDSMKNTKYIDTRMNELFPSRKSRFTMPSGKHDSKVNLSTEQTSLRNSAYIPTHYEGKSQPPLCCMKKSEASVAVPKDDINEACEKTTSNKNTFRSVAELSLGSDRLYGLAAVNMDTALRGLVSHKPSGPTYSHADPHGSTETFTKNYSSNFCGECLITGKKAPLDLTLKTYMRVVSSSTVNLFHRSLMSGTYNGMTEFSFQNSSSGNKKISMSPESTMTSLAFNSKALHSWVYPQSSLPASVISALTLTAKNGVDMDFLNQRHLAWEDSFRCLYYMLRKNACDIFYVCCTQFVVMFTACDGLGSAKRSCSAYISRSTRGLRSLIKENDIHFSMPLCRSMVEQVTTEDLVELSEIEKHNLGQTRRLSSVSDVDNSSQSLLFFSGNENVHGLYDFLLNYRSYLTSLTGVDVPLLYSRAPFLNGSLSAPKISCKELKKIDHNINYPLKASNSDNNDSKLGSSNGFCYSIEIKDSYIPPWIISTVCSVMGSEGRNFEASFITEQTSIGLNVALEKDGKKSDLQGGTEGTTNIEGEEKDEDEECKKGLTFGIEDTINTRKMCCALLKGLKFCNNSYTASLSSSV